jgi:diaminopimelate decarboxylase
MKGRTIMKKFENSVTFDGQNYLMQSKTLKSICEEVETPFYIYDVNYILKKYDMLKKCFPYENLKIFYAVKANYNPHILTFMRDHGFYLDTVSPAEVILAIKLGFDKERILFTANNMTDKEMRIIKEQGVLFNIDSLYRLEVFAKTYPGESVCLRINPEVIAGEDAKVQTSGELSKFGILFDDVKKAVEIANKYDVKIIGLHEHTGSGISDTGKIYESMENLLGAAEPELFPDLKFIDFGGGFKVPYEPDEKEIDYVEFGNRCVSMFEAFCKKFGRRLDMYFEPGKFIMADSACMIVRVNTVKNNKGRLIVGTDSGFPHLIRPVFYGAYHHIINISNPLGEVKKYDIYGNTCEAGDCFAEQREIGEIRVGDYLAIMNAGAYCRSMASEYNLRPLPTECYIYNNEFFLSRQKLTHSELAERILFDYGIK